MATSEERLKILKMIQDGKISVEQGMSLLEAMASAKPATPAASAPAAATPAHPHAARWFRVRVTDMDTGKVRVNIRMPINVVTTGFKLGARFSPEVEGMDMTQLMDAIRAGETGQIVDVVDEKDGEHVEVFLE
jgi:hypothetical protein